MTPEQIAREELPHKKPYYPTDVLAYGAACAERALREAVLAAAPEVCEWDEDSCGLWNSDCDHIFELNDGTPTENDMKFCFWCGRRLKEHKFDDTLEETP